MARETEALQAWTESLIYQQSKLSISESNRLTGGQTALLKAHAGIVLEKVNSQALQLMGGMGLTRGGAGERIERVWREIKGLTIPGGSEDVSSIRRRSAEASKVVREARLLTKLSFFLSPYR